ncbi:hypothetical protein AB0F07_22540 [Streptomyces fructofermentans]|uniref:hypothetical protein n=1 Tax=Streptomyces fructofermentans TaxID=152141 RepID=UPI0033E2FBA4
MTIPAPAPKGSRSFNPRAFPGDLLDAQRELAGLYAALHAHQKTLPWSREASEGWQAEREHGRERAGRERTDGCV